MVAKCTSAGTGPNYNAASEAPLGEALKYIAKYWQGLCLFLTDGRIEVDNNTADPLAYLTNTLTAIVNGHKQSRIDELLPWNFTPSS